MKIVLISNPPAGQASPLLKALRVGGHAVETCEPESIHLPFGDAYVLDDVAAPEVSGRIVETLPRRVESGAGLLVTGGLHAYGRGGWDATPLARLLPVDIEAGDDRDSVPSGLFLRRRASHAIFQGLPWDQPPVITGCHRVVPKAGAEVVLEGVRVIAIGPTTASLAARTTPLLVLGHHGSGRVAALATDLGGRWSSGWIGWGSPSIPDGEGGEMGSGFCRFASRLLMHVAGADKGADVQLDWRTPMRIPRVPSAPLAAVALRR